MQLVRNSRNNSPIKIRDRKEDDEKKRHKQNPNQPLISGTKSVLCGHK